MFRHMSCVFCCMLYVVSCCLFGQSSVDIDQGIQKVKFKVAQAENEKNT